MAVSYVDNASQDVYIHTVTTTSNSLTEENDTLLTTWSDARSTYLIQLDTDVAFCGQGANSTTTASGTAATWSGNTMTPGTAITMGSSLSSAHKIFAKGSSGTVIGGGSDANSTGSFIRIVGATRSGTTLTKESDGDFYTHIFSGNNSDQECLMINVRDNVFFLMSGSAIVSPFGRYSLFSIDEDIGKIYELSIEQSFNEYDLTTGTDKAICRLTENHIVVINNGVSTTGQIKNIYIND